MVAYHDLGRMDYMCPDCRAQWTNKYEAAYFDPDTGLKTWSEVRSVPERHADKCWFSPVPPRLTKAQARDEILAQYRQGLLTYTEQADYPFEEWVDDMADQIAEEY